MDVINVGFWKKATIIIVLFVIHGIIAEDLFREINASGRSLNWLISLVACSFQLAVSYSKIKKHHLSEGKLIMEIKSFLMLFKMEYLAIGFLTSFASVSGNVASTFLNYNTVKMMKSAKLIFLMIACWIMLGHEYTRKCLYLALVQVSGFCLLTVADLSQMANNGNKVQTMDSSRALQMFGFFIMLLCLFSTAILNAIQESCFTNVEIKFCEKRKPTRRQPLSEIVVDELLFFTMGISFIIVFCGCIVLNEFSSGYAFFTSVHPRFIIQLGILVSLNAYGKRHVLDFVRLYGTASANVIITLRQVISYFVSIWLFPKIWTSSHVTAIAIISVSSFYLQQELREISKREKELEAEAEMHEKIVAP